MTRAEPFKKAQKAYESFIQKYPKSEWVPQAEFGIASCLEEEDLLELAYQKYETLKARYPSQRVIGVKLARIKERLALRKR